MNIPYKALDDLLPSHHDLFVVLNADTPRTASRSHAADETVRILSKQSQTTRHTRKVTRVGHMCDIVCCGEDLKKFTGASSISRISSAASSHRE